MRVHTVYSRFKALDYEPTHEKMREAGKLIGALFKQTYQRNPPRYGFMVLGKKMQVNTYRESFGPMMDEIIHQLHSKEVPGVEIEPVAPVVKPVTPAGKSEVVEAEQTKRIRKRITVSKPISGTPRSGRI